MNNTNSNIVMTFSVSTPDCSNWLEAYRVLRKILTEIRRILEPFRDKGVIYAAGVEEQIINEDGTQRARVSIFVNKPLILPTWETITDALGDICEDDYYLI